MEPKRRLPIIGSSSPPAPSSGGGEGGEAERPPWHWVGFGTAAIFAAWLPLAYLAEALKARAIRGYLGETRTIEETQAALAGLSDAERTKLTALTVLLYIAPLMLAAYAGGFLVGKWGGKAGVREAALAGISTALIVSALTLASGALSSGAGAASLLAPIAVAFALATPMAAWGGHAGTKRRAAP